MFPRNATDHIENKEITRIISELGLSHQDLFEESSWLGVPIHRKEFQSILVDRGICYTFNILNSRSIYTDVYVFQWTYRNLLNKLNVNLFQELQRSS